MVAQARKPGCSTPPMSDHPQIILAGDIGGTKSNLAILSIENETSRFIATIDFPVAITPA